MHFGFGHFKLETFTEHSSGNELNWKFRTKIQERRLGESLSSLSLYHSRGINPSSFANSVNMADIKNVNIV